ncbi:MAG: hypothetical protein WB764_02440 [Xanthobacteraceae bacterium]
MSFLRSILLLLAFVSPAFSQDGPSDATVAQNAAQAFGIYLDGVLKSGGQPNFTKPPAADLFRHIFDVAALNALPPAKADDIRWLLQWGAAVDQSYKRIILFGLQPSQPVDQLVMRRNMSEYQDQCATAMGFLIRFEARQATTLTLFLDQLPVEQRTPARAAGLQQARSGSAQTITGAMTAMMQGMKPANARLIAGALRDTRDTWATYLMPDDRTKIASMLADMPAALKDRETQKNLTAFAGALAAAKQPTELKP